MTIQLFPFRYRDALTGRWVKARYKATPEEIAARYTEWEMTGPAEVRSPIGGSFQPYRIVTNAELKRLEEAAPEINPHLERPPAVDRAECSLVVMFLRRYVTYCARRGRYAELQGAARLHSEVAAVMQAPG